MIHDINKTLRILLIFADSSVSNQLAFPDDLRELLQASSDEMGYAMSFETTTAKSLSLFVSNDMARVYDHRNKSDLKEYDFVYFRKAGPVMQQMLACAVYLRQHDIPYADREIGMSNSRNKLSQMFMLQEKGISVPTTLFVRNRRRLVRLITGEYNHLFTWPVIAKATGGTRGDANYLVNSPEELAELVQSVRRHFLVQSYIPNDGDYRALVIHDTLRGVIKRKGEEGSHLNNTSKNGDATWLPHDALSAEHRLLAVRAAQVFKRDIAGVDILIDKKTDMPYILEVNRAPQIEGASYPVEKARVLVEGIRETIEDYGEAYTSAAQNKLVGRREFVRLPAFPGAGRLIAKIDTGAYSNALHVDYVEERVTSSGEKSLAFRLEYRGEEYETREYSKKTVTSSNGVSEERFMVDLEYEIGEDRLMGQTTLTDRARMQNPVLIGRRFLRQHGLVVDVRKRNTQ